MLAGRAGAVGGLGVNWNTEGGREPESWPCSDGAPQVSHKVGAGAE